MTGMKRYFLIAILTVLVTGILFGLIRAIIGPRRADRIMGINMIGTLSTASIALLSVILEENWLLDVSLVYCLISFLAVMVLGKIHIGERKEEPHE